MRTDFKALADRTWAVTRNHHQRLYFANGGIGDELMMSAVVAAARSAGRPISVIARYAELWAGNTDPISVEFDIERWFYAVRRGWVKTEIIHLSCFLGRGKHLAVQMADHAGVSLPENWRPVFHPAGSSRRDSGLLVLQNSCRGALYAAPTKEWPHQRWVELAKRLSKSFRLIQIGAADDPVLPFAEDLRGRTTFREAAALLSTATVFVGLESGLAHLAAAMRTPSVIIFGGRSLPSETGYPFNTNITRSPPCAGCGLNTDCPHQMICMEIDVEEVEQAVLQACSRKVHV